MLPFRVKKGEGVKNEGKCMGLVRREGLRSLLINLSLSLMVRIFAGAKKGEREGRNKKL